MGPIQVPFGELITEALKVSGISFGGVFLVLTLFFFLVKVMMRLFPDKKNGQEGNA